MDTIPMDQVGFQRLLLEIESVEEELQNIRSSRAEQMGQEHAHDAILENPIIFELATQERQAIRRLNDLKRKKECARIIEPKKIANIVGLGSVVRVLFLEDSSPTMTLKVVSNSPKEGEISLQCPLGKAIYGHKIGDIIEYTVSDCFVMVKVVAID